MFAEGSIRLGYIAMLARFQLIAGMTGSNIRIYELKDKENLVVEDLADKMYLYWLNELNLKNAL